MIVKMPTPTCTYTFKTAATYVISINRHNTTARRNYIEKTLFLLPTSIQLPGDTFDEPASTSNANVLENNLDKPSDTANVNSTEETFDVSASSANFNVIEDSKSENTWSKYITGQNILNIESFYCGNIFRWASAD